MVMSRLVFWYLVLALLSESSAYSNSKELVRFTLNMRESTRILKLILFQWSPRINQEVRLSARGGCANNSRDYKWFSSDSRIVSVTPYGIIQARMPGVATVKVVSTCDPQKYDLKVQMALEDHVKAPDQMEMTSISRMRGIDPWPGPTGQLLLTWKPLDEDHLVLNLTLISLMIRLAIYIGHLIFVYCPANPHIEPCSSASHSDIKCHRTKWLRRPTTLATMVVEKRIYRRRWFFRPYISSVVYSPVGELLRENKISYQCSREKLSDTNLQIISYDKTLHMVDKDMHFW